MLCLHVLCLHLLHPLLGKFQLLKVLEPVQHGEPVQGSCSKARVHPPHREAGRGEHHHASLHVLEEAHRGRGTAKPMQRYQHIPMQPVKHPCPALCLLDLLLRERAALESQDLRCSLLLCRVSSREALHCLRAPKERRK